MWTTELLQYNVPQMTCANYHQRIDLRCRLMSLIVLCLSNRWPVESDRCSIPPIIKKLISPTGTITVCLCPLFVFVGPQLSSAGGFVSSDHMVRGRSRLSRGGMFTNNSFVSCDFQTGKTDVCQSDGTVSSYSMSAFLTSRHRLSPLSLQSVANEVTHFLSAKTSITVKLCNICNQTLMSPQHDGGLSFSFESRWLTDLSTTTRYLLGVSSGLGPAALLPRLRWRERQKGR